MSSVYTEYWNSSFFSNTDATICNTADLCSSRGLSMISDNNIAASSSSSIGDDLIVTGASSRPLNQEIRIFNVVFSQRQLDVKMQASPHRQTYLDLESLLTNDQRKEKKNSSSDEDSSSKRPTSEQHIKAKTCRVYVRAEAADTSLIVRDGYQWRKYGQRLTRDNLSPRAYFKCSFAPTCPIKKKVQRSVDDQSILVVTYEGEHNHPRLSKTDATSPAAVVPCPSKTAVPVIAEEKKVTSSASGHKRKLSRVLWDLDIK